MTAGSERPRRLRLVEWRPIIKGALRGFATVELPVGLTIADVPVLTNHGKAWAALPSKMLLNSDGTPKLDDNGKALYVPILRWRGRELADRFSVAVVELVRAAHPYALGEGGAP